MITSINEFRMNEDAAKDYLYYKSLVDADKKRYKNSTGGESEMNMDNLSYNRKMMNKAKATLKKAGKPIPKVNENNNDESTRFNYMMLSRLQSDCEYFLNWGKGRSQLHSGTVEQHIAKMKELWNILEIKPEWLSMEQILQYETDMLAKRDAVNAEDAVNKKA